MAQILMDAWLESVLAETDPPWIGNAEGVVALEEATREAQMGQPEPEGGWYEAPPVEERVCDRVEPLDREGIKRFVQEGGDLDTANLDDVAVMPGESTRSAFFREANWAMRELLTPGQFYGMGLESRLARERRERERDVRERLARERRERHHLAFERERRERERRRLDNQIARVDRRLTRMVQRLDRIEQQLEQAQTEQQTEQPPVEESPVEVTRRHIASCRRRVEAIRDRRVQLQARRALFEPPVSPDT